jgi:hypothetical protein
MGMSWAFATALSAEMGDCPNVVMSPALMGEMGDG